MDAIVKDDLELDDLICKCGLSEFNQICINHEHPIKKGSVVELSCECNNCGNIIINYIYNQLKKE